MTIKEQLIQIASNAFSNRHQAAIVTKSIKKYLADHPEKLHINAKHLRQRYAERYDAKYANSSINDIIDMTTEAIMNASEIIAVLSQNYANKSSKNIVKERGVNICIKLYDDYNDYYSACITDDDDNTIIVTTILTEELTANTATDYDRLKDYKFIPKSAKEFIRF